jgi:hypothetical protein
VLVIQLDFLNFQLLFLNQLITVTMTNDNNFDNSSNNIQKFFSDNVIGSVHMSQYRDPNDEASSYNSGDTQDPNINQDLTIHQLGNKEIYGQNQDDLYTDDDTFNSAVNNISIVLEQTKRTHTQTDKNNVPTMDDPFKTFLTANNNPISLHKRILISQKRDTPTITKKFQAHPPTQIPTTTKPSTKEDNFLKDPSVTPAYESNKTMTSDISDKVDVIPTNTSDQQNTEHESLTDTDAITTEENVEPSDNSTNYHMLYGLTTTITDPHNDNSSSNKGLIITPKNRSISKRIINPYAKNQYATTTPLTDFIQTINTEQRTPNPILPKIINFNPTDNITTPSSKMSNNTTPPFQTNYSNIPKETRNINTNVTLTNPFLLNIKQASNSSTRNINLPQELEPL